MNAVVSQSAPDVRRMRETDLSRVVAVERRAYAFPWTPGVFRDCMRVGYSCWVLVADCEVSGHLILSQVAGEAHVLNLCVAPEAHRRGYGQCLLSTAVGHARERGASTLFLEVRPSNNAALSLYRRNGFCEVGLRPGYYPVRQGQREDALILALEIGSPFGDAD